MKPEPRAASSATTSTGVAYDGGGKRRKRLSADERLVKK